MCGRLTVGRFVLSLCFFARYSPSIVFVRPCEAVFFVVLSAVGVCCSFMLFGQAAKILTHLNIYTMCTSYGLFLFFSMMCRSVVWAYSAYLDRTQISRASLPAFCACLRVHLARCCRAERRWRLSSKHTHEYRASSRNIIALRWQQLLECLCVYWIVQEDGPFKDLLDFCF